MLAMIAASAVFPSYGNATEFWTVKAEGGVLAKVNGQVAFNIGSFQPTAPNPSTAVWTSCPSNWIYFHETVDGAAVGSDQLDRMRLPLSREAASGSRWIGILRAPATLPTCWIKALDALGNLCSVGR